MRLDEVVLVYSDCEDLDQVVQRILCRCGRRGRRRRGVGRHRLICSDGGEGGLVRSKPRLSERNKLADAEIHLDRLDVREVLDGVLTHDEYVNRRIVIARRHGNFHAPINYISRFTIEKS